MYIEPHSFWSMLFKSPFREYLQTLKEFQNVFISKSRKKVFKLIQQKRRENFSEWFYDIHPIQIKLDTFCCEERCKLSIEILNFYVLIIKSALNTIFYILSSNQNKFPYQFLCMKKFIFISQIIIFLIFSICVYSHENQIKINLKLLRE